MTKLLTVVLCLTILTLGTARGQGLTYPIIDSNQQTCYDTEGAIRPPEPGQPFYGQDAQVQELPPSYRDNGDGTVSDLHTGLMWQQSPDTDGDGEIRAADKLTLEEALAYPEKLNRQRFAGHRDWRLPSIKELYSLILFSGVDPGLHDGGGTPFIDTTVFDFAYGDTSAGERVIDSQWVSRTAYVDSSEMKLVFGVNFADGRIKGYPVERRGRSKTFYTICVRGNPEYGTNRFEASGRGHVIDKATGLMWSRGDSRSTYTWEEALAVVQKLNEKRYLGYNDWRLPSVKELQSIVDYSRSPGTTRSAAIDPIFMATTIRNETGERDWGYYWSSTTHVNAMQGGVTAAYICFGRGLGYDRRQRQWIDIHGAGSQRSDPKEGDADDFPQGRGPQGDAIRIENLVRVVRTVQPPDQGARRTAPTPAVPAASSRARGR